MKRLCKNKHWKIEKRYNIDKILYLLIDRPKIKSVSGNFIWRNNKNLIYRDYNLPAIIWTNGFVTWRQINYI